MKKIMILILSGTLLLTAPGCGTMHNLFNPSQNELIYLQSVTRAVSAVAAYEYANAKPENMAKVVLARNAVDALLGGGQIDPIALSEALSASGMEEAKAKGVAILLSGLLVQVQNPDGTVTLVDNFERAKAVAIGFRDGLNLAVGYQK